MKIGLGILFLAVALAGCEHGPAPEDGRAAYLAGYQALKAGDYPTAEQRFTEAASILPDDAYVQLNLGVVEQNLGKLDAARGYYRRAIELGKTSAPRDVTDPRYAGRTVAQLAQDDLAAMPN